MWYSKVMIFINTLIVQLLKVGNTAVPLMVQVFQLLFHQSIMGHMSQNVLAVFNFALTFSY